MDKPLSSSQLETLIFLGEQGRTHLSLNKQGMLNSARALHPKGYVRRYTDGSWALTGKGDRVYFEHIANKTNDKEKQDGS